MSEIIITSPLSCAFLFIDLQPLFTDRFNNTEFQQQVERALEFARTTCPPERIVHLRADYVDSKMRPFTRVLNPSKPVPCDITATTWASEVSEEVVITKKTINGFHDTNLEEYLVSIGVDTIICCGLLTCCCVHETAIGGMVRGFHPILIEDACADRTEEKHDATIKLYKDYMYQTCKLQDLSNVLSTPS